VVVVVIALRRPTLSEGVFEYPIEVKLLMIELHDLLDYDHDNENDHEHRFDEHRRFLMQYSPIENPEEPEKKESRMETYESFP